MPPDPTPNLRLPHFDPPPDVADQVLDQLTHPAFRMTDVCSTFNVTLEALCAWMTRPDIAARLDNLESVHARRTRLIAAAHLPQVAHAAGRILFEYNDEESHSLYDPKSIQGREQKRRNRETARRAGALLLRLARFQPGAAVARAYQPVPKTPRAQSLPSLEDLRATLAPLFTPQDAEPELLSAESPRTPQDAEAEAPRSLRSEPPASDDPALSNLKTEILSSAPSAPTSPRSGRNTLSPGRESRETTPESRKPAEPATHRTTPQPHAIHVPLTISAPAPALAYSNGHHPNGHAPAERPQAP